MIGIHRADLHQTPVLHLMKSAVYHEIGQGFGHVRLIEIIPFFDSIFQRACTHIAYAYMRWVPSVGRNHVHENHRVDIGMVQIEQIPLVDPLVGRNESGFPDNISDNVVNRACFRRDVTHHFGGMVSFRIRGCFFFDFDLHPTVVQMANSQAGRIAIRGGFNTCQYNRRADGFEGQVKKIPGIRDRPLRFALPV